MNNSPISSDSLDMTVIPKADDSVVLARTPAQLAKFLVTNAKEVNRMLKIVVQDDEIKESLMSIARKIAEKASHADETAVEEIIEVEATEQR